MPTDLSSLLDTILNVSLAFGITEEAFEEMVRVFNDFIYKSISEALFEGYDPQAPTNAMYGEFIDPLNCLCSSSPDWKIHQQSERQFFYQLEEQKHKYNENDWESMILNGVVEINTRKEIKL